MKNRHRYRMLTLYPYLRDVFVFLGTIPPVFRDNISERCRKSLENLSWALDNQNDEANPKPTICTRIPGTETVSFQLWRPMPAQSAPYSTPDPAATQDQSSSSDPSLDDGADQDPAADDTDSPDSTVSDDSTNDPGMDDSSDDSGSNDPNANDPALIGPPLVVSGPNPSPIARRRLLRLTTILDPTVRPPPTRGRTIRPILILIRP